jgi:hypothetical protein
VEVEADALMVTSIVTPMVTKLQDVVERGAKVELTVTVDLLAQLQVVVVVFITMAAVAGQDNHLSTVV